MHVISADTTVADRIRFDTPSIGSDTIPSDNRPCSKFASKPLCREGERDYVITVDRPADKRPSARHLLLSAAVPSGSGALCTVLFSLGSDTRHSGEVIGGEGCCILAPDWSTS